jgi:integrase/recombinase XerD
VQESLPVADNQDGPDGVTLLTPARSGQFTSQWFLAKGNLQPITVANHFFRTKEGGWAINTRKDYAKLLADWYRFCERAGVDPVSAQRNELVTYLEHMRERVKGSTVNKRVGLLEHWFSFLVNARYRIALPFGIREVWKSVGMLRGTVTHKSIVSDLRLRAEQRQHRRYCVRSELIEFIKALRNNRDEIAARIMYATGIRVSELISLTLDHLPTDLSGYITRKQSARVFVIGKGAKERMVQFPAGLLSEISEYIGGLRGKAATRQLLVSLDRRRLPITAQAIQSAFAKLAKKMGIIGLTAHKFRHGYAMERLIFLTRLYGQDNKPTDDREIFTPAYRALKQVSSELGHADISSTEEYLQFLDTYTADYNQDHIDWLKQILPEGEV